MTDEASVLLFFIDGLGIGSRGPFNPLDGLADAEPLAVFSGEVKATVFEGVVVPTDPRLGIPGRPQSATGQATILTGVNAPLQLGYHKQGFPNAAMRELISQHSIFLQLKNAGISKATFANAHRTRFFEKRPRWVSATTTAVEAAGIPFRTIAELREGKALFHDFTNEMLSSLGIEAEARSGAEAAEILVRIASENRFTLYEYFITDKLGHAQDFDRARVKLKELALFIRELLSRIDFRCTTVILTSDHGNIEDLSTRNHTLNDVPTIVWGANRERIAAQIKNLSDITPVIVDTLTS